ncbi:hypothetical protein D3C85_1826180 [compost metagenome]
MFAQGVAHVQSSTLEQAIRDGHKRHVVLQQGEGCTHALQGGCQRLGPERRASHQRKAAAAQRPTV